jgi:hypothetical protein
MNNLKTVQIFHFQTLLLIWMEMKIIIQVEKILAGAAEIMKKMR